MIVDVRARLRQKQHDRIPHGFARLCPHCGCRARAYKSKTHCTYYRFHCGAPSYKQSRSLSALIVLRTDRNRMHAAGCA
jgi:hypothetical protein